jgi:serine phosphatase RsbU (regulator of sigma subunit)
VAQERGGGSKSDADSGATEANAALAAASDLAETIQRLADLVLAKLGDLCVVDLVAEDGTLRRKVVRHRDPALGLQVERLRRYQPIEPVALRPAIRPIEDARTVWSPAMDDHDFEELQAMGLRSYLAVPMVASGEVIGVITIFSGGSGLDSSDLQYAEQFARGISPLVGSALRHDADVKTSHVLQHSLLPNRLPSVPGLQMATRYLPATEGMDVGGDFYDLVVLPSNRVGFMIGDVAGHDRDAAAAMGQLRSAARALSGQVHSPAALVAALQWSWDLLGIDRIATALFGRLDQNPGSNHGDLVLASAGHPPPLLIEAHARQYLPVSPAAPLGAPPTAAKNWTGRLEKGDVLLLYTDGALDERHGGMAEAMERLAGAATAGDPDPESVCQRIVDMVSSDRTDDIALLSLRLVG